MPLITTDKAAIPIPRGIGCLMAVKDAHPAELIWVVATPEALAQLDPSELPDQHSIVFKKNRPQIEGAASEKFDKDGVDPNEPKHEGRRVLLVRSDDLT